MHTEIKKIVDELKNKNINSSQDLEVNLRDLLGKHSKTFTKNEKAAIRYMIDNFNDIDTIGKIIDQTLAECWCKHLTDLRLPTSGSTAMAGACKS